MPPRKKKRADDGVDGSAAAHSPPPPVDVDEGRPKRSRKPSRKALEDADGANGVDGASGSSVEAILPSYVSSGSSLRSLSGSGEENDAVRTVPDAAGMFGQKEGSGGSACPSKQGSNEADGKNGGGSGMMGAKHGWRPSSLKDATTNSAFGHMGHMGHMGAKATKRGLDDLQEYYQQHADYHMERMRAMNEQMLAKAQELVLNGEDLASIKMQEGLLAVSTANAIIFRSSFVAPKAGAGMVPPGVDPGGLLMGDTGLAHDTFR